MKRRLAQTSQLRGKGSEDSSYGQGPFDRRVSPWHTHTLRRQLCWLMALSLQPTAELVKLCRQQRRTLVTDDSAVLAPRSS